MIALGMGAGWIGYAMALYGFCLVRGYDISLADLVNPARVFNWPHPPPMLPDDAITPAGGGATGSAAAPALDVLKARPAKKASGDQVADSFPLIGPGDG